MSAKAEVTYTFAVTFKAPAGMSISSARTAIKESLEHVAADAKVSLTNKEVSYGKR